MATTRMPKNGRELQERLIAEVTEGRRFVSEIRAQIAGSHLNPLIVDLAAADTEVVFSGIEILAIRELEAILARMERDLRAKDKALSQKSREVARLRTELAKAGGNPQLSVVPPRKASGTDGG